MNTLNTSKTQNNFVALKEVNNGPKKIPLWVYIWVALRSFLLQNGFNYANFQGLGYANTIYPGLKRIYANNPAKLKEALLQNIEFYNTNPQLIPLITSIHLSLLSSGQDVNDARTIKMSLMGPLSGIGDSLTQFALFPLFSIIAIGFGQTGEILGPIIFILGMNITLIILKCTMGWLGWKLGESAIAKLTMKMQTILQVAGMLGVTIISALALRLTRVRFTLDFSQRIETGTGAETSTISVQTILDNILPYFASALWVIFIYFMLTKFNWTPYKVIIVTLIVGITCGVFGILGV